MNDATAAAGPAERKPTAGRASGGDLVAIATAAVLAGVVRLVPMANPDVLWQARTGDLVLATGRRVATDAFSRFFRGRPIHDHEPAWEALVALADRTPWRLTTLWWANLVLAIVVTAASVRIAGRTVREGFARVLGAAIVVIAVSQRLELRAEAASFAAIAIAHGIRRGGAQPWRKLAPIACAGVGILFHGLAWLACAVPLAWALDAAVRGLRSPDAAARRLATPAALLDVGVAIATVTTAELVTPGTLRNVFASGQAKTFVTHIVEGFTPWQVYQRSHDALPLFTIGVTALATFGLALLARDRRANYADVVLVAALALPGLRWVRFVAMPLLAMLPWTIAGVSELFSRGLRPLHASLRASVAGATFAIAFGLACLGVVENGVGARVGGFAWDRQPVAATEWLREHRPNANLFHAYNHGAYLIYVRWPPSGVVLDARAPTAYPDSFAERYYAALERPELFDAWAREAGFDTVLVTRANRNTTRLGRYLFRSDGWHAAHQDSLSIVFARGPRPPGTPKPELAPDPEEP
jgi:hypothetical protein